MPRRTSELASLRANDCKYWTVAQWEQCWREPHQKQYLKKLDAIRQTLETIGGAGADSRYIHFLIEHMIPTEYPNFKWRLVTSRYQKFEQALLGLKHLAKNGHLPGESVNPLVQAWRRFLMGKRGHRTLTAQLFVAFKVPVRAGRPVVLRFKKLAYLISTHLRDHQVKPVWKRTAELLAPFAPAGQVCDEEHIRQLIVKFKAKAGREYLGLVKSSLHGVYQQLNQGE